MSELGSLSATVIGIRADGKQRALRCPAHDDSRASLSVGVGDDGRVLLKCFAGCTFTDIIAAAGIAADALAPQSLTPAAKPTRAMLTATYDYCDIDDKILFQVVRYEPKNFRQRRPDGRGGWTWKLGDVRRVVYHWPELNRRLKENPTLEVVICEGEKDADCLWRQGILSTTCAGGAGKWTSEYTQQIIGAGATSIAVIADNDEPGKKHAEQVAHSFAAAGVAVKIVDLPDLPIKGDVSDWLDGPVNRQIEDLHAQIALAPLYLKPAGNESAVFEARVHDEYDRERARREARRRLEAEARGHLPAPDIATLRERLARPRCDMGMRIEGWQPRGARVMLAAQYKTGKTTVIGNLARSYADGDAWLGRYAVTPITGTVVIIDTEMGTHQIDAWLEAQRIVADDRVVVIPLRGMVSTFDPLDARVRADWAARLLDVRAETLIVDCLRPIMDALGLDEHRDAGRLLVGLDALMAEAGIREACVVHHMGHTGERARGDSRLRDWPDVEWRIVRQDDDPAAARYITAYGRDVDQPEQQLAYDVETRRLSIAGGSRREAATADALAAVLEVLDGAVAPLSARAILAALADSEHPRDSIRAAIRSGIQDRLIATSPGPRRAVLHRRFTECAGVRDERAAHTVSECAAAYMEPRTHDHPEQIGDPKPDRALNPAAPLMVARPDPYPWSNLPRAAGNSETAARMPDVLAEKAPQRGAP